MQNTSKNMKRLDTMLLKEQKKILANKDGNNVAVFYICIEHLIKARYRDSGFVSASQYLTPSWPAFDNSNNFLCVLLN